MSWLMLAMSAPLCRPGSRLGDFQLVHAILAILAINLKEQRHPSQMVELATGES